MYSEPKTNILYQNKCTLSKYQVKHIFNHLQNKIYMRLRPNVTIQNITDSIAETKRIRSFEGDSTAHLMLRVSCQFNMASSEATAPKNTKNIISQTTTRNNEKQPSYLYNQQELHQNHLKARPSTLEFWRTRVQLLDLLIASEYWFLGADAASFKFKKKKKICLKHVLFCSSDVSLIYYFYDPSHHCFLPLQQAGAVCWSSKICRWTVEKLRCYLP